MPNPSRKSVPRTITSRSVTVDRTLFRHLRARNLPLEVQRAINYFVTRRSRGLRGKAQDKQLTGTDISALRVVPKEKRGARFEEELKKAHESIAGKLARAAFDSNDLLAFLKSRKYIFVDRNRMLIGSNHKRVVGRRRIATEDILWLMRHP